MKRFILLFLSFATLTLTAQTKEKIRFYSQNNTGFPISLSDFALDENNNIYLAHYYRDKLNPGGLTYFDGEHWSLTKKGKNNFPFENGIAVYYYNGELYVFGSYLHSDDGEQQYKIAHFNSAENNWKIIGKKQDEDACRSNCIFDFVVTSEGKMYSAQLNGFYQLLPDSAYKYYPGNYETFNPQKIELISNGNMYLLLNWVDGWGNGYTGIYYFDGEVVLPVKDPLDSLNSALDFKLGPNGNLWILAHTTFGQSYLEKFSPSDGSEVKFLLEESNYVNYSFAKDGNFLWIGKSGGRLIKFDTETHEQTVYNIINPESPGYSSDIYKIIVHGSYLYLQLSNSSVVKVNKETCEIVAHWSTANTGIPDDFGSPGIVGIITDNQNHYWLTDLNDGVAMYNGDTWRAFSPMAIGSQMVVTAWDIASDYEGNIFTVGDSVRIWNESQGWKAIQPSTSFYGYSVSVDQNNSIWIADYYNGLLKFNKQTEEFQLYPGNEIGGTYLRKVFVDKNNNVWLGFQESYPSYFDGDNFHHFSNSDGIEGTSVTEIDEAPDGSIWYAFMNNGLAKYANGTWTSYTQANANVPIEAIRAMAIDNNGKVWIGSNNESDTVAVYSFDGNSWEKIILDSNATGTILKITVDANNNLWVSAGYVGLYVYNAGEIVIHVDDNSETPKYYTLEQNYPNPFNPTTTINYTLPKSVSKQNLTSSQHVTLNVYDALGRKVATLVNERQAPGNYSVKFDGSDLPSGVYFYTLRAGSFTTTKKMVLMK